MHLFKIYSNLFILLAFLACKHIDSSHSKSVTSSSQYPTNLINSFKALQVGLYSDESTLISFPDLHVKDWAKNHATGDSYFSQAAKNDAMVEVILTVLGNSETFNLPGNDLMTLVRMSTYHKDIVFVEYDYIKERLMDALSKDPSFKATGDKEKLSKLAKELFDTFKKQPDSFRGTLKAYKEFKQNHKERNRH